MIGVMEGLEEKMAGVEMMVNEDVYNSSKARIDEDCVSYSRK